MPHALWELQGERRAKFVEAKDPHDPGRTMHRFAGVRADHAGHARRTQQYDEAIGDLVAYLQWMGEPVQATRVRVGVGVLVFLGLLVRDHLAVELGVLERRSLDPLPPTWRHAREAKPATRPLRLPHFS